VRGCTPGRVLVTGAAGMLGSQLLLDVPDGWEVVGTDLAEANAEGGPLFAASGVDLADEAAVAKLFEEHGPFVGVIHGAAYTAVDPAEENEALALKVNGTAAGVVAAACAGAKIPCVMVGTDFVFDGTKRTPYAENAEPSPLSAYGRTKLAGEVASVEAHPEGTRIVRTQWLYGPRGANFPRTILRLARERGELSVVDDQLGSPTSTLELSPALWDVLQSGEAGIYHAACDGHCSWFGFASAAVSLAGVPNVKLEPCGTDAFPRPAPRPAYSVLSCDRLTALRGRTLAPWREALATYLEQAEPQ
jgi:dTDP-4-dehydrorhamnose reductase